MNSRQINEYLSGLGLINVRALDPSIVPDLRYATSDNFTGGVLYEQRFDIFAEPELARRLAGVSNDLRRIMPDYRLVVFDAVRPLSVQYKMYENVRGTSMEPYIANPYGEFSGGFHNFGMAADISICNPDGILLDMGTDFDSFSPLAHAGDESRFVVDGKLSVEAYTNRALLYYLTGKNGLMPHPYEWWHYQYYQQEEDKRKFKLIDFSFDV